MIWLFLMIGASVALAALLLGKTFLLRKRVLADLEQMEYIEEQYSKALTNLRSGDRREIVHGLQLICAFNEPRAQLRVLPEVRKLIDHDDPRVAACARTVLDQIIADLEAQHASAEA